MIDWTLAERIAAGVAGTPSGGTALEGDLALVATQARERVIAYTGLEPARTIPEPQAVDRREWLRLNLRGMRTMMEPLEHKLGQGGPLRGAGGLLLGAEIGGLTGYLSQRVLGQYELVLLDPASPERLLFVAPNLREAARRLDVGEADLVAWVGIHEVTHAVQFTGVPWLREHLASELRALLETVDVDVDLARLPASPERLLFVAPNLREAARRLEVGEADLVAWVGIHEVTHAVQFTGVPWLREHLASRLRALLETVDVKVDVTKLPTLDDLRGAVERFRGGGLVTMVAGPERMAILDEVQATMAVVEGHAEHVMDAVGEELLPTLPELREALDRRRREKPPAVRLLERLIGLELKLRQYELGRSFCDGVVERGGIETLNRVWAAPEALPTLAELEAPGRWIERTATPSLPRA